MNRIILGDNQAIFRAGAARVLALEEDMRIVAQCDDLARLLTAIDGHKGALVVFSSTLASDIKQVAQRVHASGSRAILIAENGAEVASDIANELDCILFRNVPGPDLLDSIRRLASGRPCIQPSGNLTTMVAQDTVGARVRDRLTPKEMQIVALIVQGCKNKHIATQLNTKEQVIKNYLRSIYDKTGVSDRLELALFTIHHKMLAEAATRAGNLLQQKTA
jgi:DNA-binding NarL/FixJ family response regulator